MFLEDEKWIIICAFCESEVQSKFSTCKSCKSKGLTGKSPRKEVYLILNEDEDGYEVGSIRLI